MALEKGLNSLYLGKGYMYSDGSMEGDAEVLGVDIGLDYLICVFDDILKDLK